MKKNFVVLIFFAVSNFSFAQGTWTQKANIGGLSRHAAVGFTVNNFGYMCSGVNGGSNFLNDMWQYDPVSNTWTQKASLPGLARCSAAGFAIGNYCYIGTGSGSGSVYYNDFWRYDAIANTWAQKASFPGAARYGAVGFSVSDSGYMGIGWNVSSYFNDIWRYNTATDSWAQKANYPGLGNVECCAFSIGSKGYAGLGAYPCNTTYTDFYEYDPVADTWTQKPDYPGNAKQNPVRFAICNKGYVGWGDNCGPPYLLDFYQYDPATGNWTVKANFPGIGRDNPFMFAIGNKGYAGTGLNGNTLSDFWEYTPDTLCSQCVPVANFNSSDTAFCSEVSKCISFTDLSTCNPISWHWLFPGALPDTSDQQNPNNICYSNPGTYPVTLIVTNTAGIDTLAVAPMIIFANLPPPPTINVTGGDTLISSHASYYQWYLNGSPIGGATDSFDVAMQGGTYSVQITDSLGCSSLSGGVLITGLFPLSFADGFGVRIYPNPVKDWFEVRDLKYEINALEIYNVLGEKLFAERLLPAESGPNPKSHFVNCKQFSAGIYFVRLVNATSSYITKFVKE